MAHGLVAQLVRALACHARGRGFEPHPSRHFSISLIYLIHYADLAHLVERHLAKVEVAGSSPVIRSKKDQAERLGLFLFIAKAMVYLLFVGRTRRITQDTASGIHHSLACISSAVGCILFRNDDIHSVPL